MQGGERPELLGDHQRRVVRATSTPPAPSLIVSVCAATWAMRTLVADEAMLAML